VERRPLGDSGLSVSVIGLGTWAMGGLEEVWGQVDDRESIATIHQALDCGINLIDTAPIYGRGHSEEIVGKAMRGRRAEVVVATKCGLKFPARPDELPPRSLAPVDIASECEDSLRRLRTDLIDLYQYHWPDPATPLRDTMATLVSLRDQGKIRAIGLSNFSCEQLATAREFGPVHAVQAPYSMLSRRAAEEILPYCREHRLGLLAYGALRRGLLTGKFSESDTFRGIRGRDADFTGDRFRRNLRVVDVLRRVADSYHRTPGQLALQWALSSSGVTAALAGAKRPSQVRENAGATGWFITAEDRARIERLLADGHDEA
jgi:aryl-alcohol dehydrogenase-like predicted oxidoreductase